MEAETKTSGDEGKENVEGRTEEGKALLDSAVKPFVEELTQAGESVVQYVTDQSSSYVAEVEKEVEKVVSDPWAAVKNAASVQESSTEGTNETLATSDENAGESSEAVKSTSAEPEMADLEENPRTTHTQPFVAATATTWASWMTCCGLLEFMRPSDQ